MNCAGASFTGTTVLELGLLGVAAVLAGVLIVRTHLSRTATVLILALLVSATFGTSTIGSSRAFAASANCGSSPIVPAGGGKLDISQTSTVTDMAPGITPAALAGLVRNNGANPVYVTAVTVAIRSVTKSAGAGAGRCSTADYVLIGAVMSVRQKVSAGSSVRFAGAQIGFADGERNQDACKGAIVHLHYSSK